MTQTYSMKWIHDSGSLFLRRRRRRRRRRGDATAGESESDSDEVFTSVSVSDVNDDDDDGGGGCDDDDRAAAVGVVEITAAHLLELVALRTFGRESVAGALQEAARLSLRV